MSRIGETIKGLIVVITTGKKIKWVNDNDFETVSFA